MDEIEARAVVRRPPREVYTALTDFPRYPAYSDYLAAVSREGGRGRGDRRSSVETDGAGGARERNAHLGPGVDTRFALRFEWWVARYIVRARVSAVDPPRRLAFDLTRGLAGDGEWTIEPAPDEAPADGGASRVRFAIRYDPGSVVDEAADLPRFVPLDRVIERIEPAIEREARRMAERVVDDLGDGRVIAVGTR